MRSISLLTNRSFSLLTRKLELARLVVGALLLGFGTSVAMALTAPTVQVVGETISGTPDYSHHYLIKWQDNSDDEDLFQIRVQVGGGSYQTITATLANNDYTTWDLYNGNSFPNGTVLNFQVYACKATFTYNSSGGITGYTVTQISGASNAKSVVYHTASTQALAAPTGVSVVAADDGHVRVQFTDNTDREDGYQFFIKKSSDASYPANADSILFPFNLTDYTISNQSFLYKVTGSGSSAVATSGLEPGTTYNIKMRAVQIVNQSVVAASGLSNEVTITMPALLAPTGLTSTPVDETKVTLNWTDNSKGEHGYLLQWKEVDAADSTFQAVTGTAANAVTYDLKAVDLSGLLLPGYQLVWRVATAYNPTSNTTNSAENYILTPGNQVTTATKFNKPENLQASVTSDAAANAATTVNLTWEDKSARETGYRVLGRVAGTTSFSVLQDLAANTTSTSFTISNPGTGYEIAVIGFYDSSGSILSTTDNSNIVSLNLKNAFTSKLSQAAIVGSAYSYTITTTGTAQRTNLTVTGLPDGLTFSNGQISGIPTDGGLYNIAMTASYNDGWVVSATMALRIIYPEGAPTKPVEIPTRRMAPGSDAVLALSDLFADKDTATARRINTNLGNIDVVLYPAQTPLTVNNFLAYADSGDYNNTVFHRNSPGFVLQGGGYRPTATSAKSFDEVTRRTSPLNEPGIPNVRGTLSLAKGGTPDSGTHDFFINLADNRSILDDNTGGFTVFGRVARLQPSPIMTGVIDAILALPGRDDYTIDLTASGATTPTTGFNPIGGGNLGTGTKWPINDASAPATMDNTKMVKMESVVSLPVMSYELTSAPEGSIAVAVINATSLVITGIAEGTTALQIKATDVDGNTTTQDIAITVDGAYLPVQITQQPVGTFGNVGETVNFSVQATGTALTYQWRRNGKDLSGQTASTLQLANITTANSGTYTVVVANEQSRVTSNEALLVVHAPPSFTSPSATQNVSQNWSGTITFSPVTIGDPTITYQWSKGGTELLGKTSQTLTLSNLSLNDSGDYTVKATNGFGDAVSPVFALTVNAIDSDHDGLTDDVEVARVPPTNRLEADTDGDGYSDGVEVKLGTNPNLATSHPGATKFVASKDGATALAGLDLKFIPELDTALFPDRLSSGTTVTIPNRWLANYELTNEQFATVLDHAMRIMDVIEVIDVDQGVGQPARRAVRYPKTTGQIVCYMATPEAISASDPPACEVDFDEISHTFFVTKTLGKMPARGISWYGSYLATLALNNKYGYTTINVPASLSFDTTKKGFIMPTYVEWEWAARGGLASGFNGTTNFGYAYPTGASVSTALAKYNDLTATAKPKNVGSFAASKLGVHDLAGNVAEWVFDGNATNGYTRGGGYSDTSEALKNLSHAAVAKNMISATVGVRLAMIESAAPAISPALLPQLVKTGATINIAVTATGAPPLAYQWYKNGKILKDKTSASLAIPNAQLTDAGAYMVKVSSHGATSSSTANVAVIDVPVLAPTYYVVPNKKTSITVKTATAPGQTLDYLWKLGSIVADDVHITGETTATMTITFALSYLAGDYHCTVKLPDAHSNPAFPAIVADYNVVVYDTPEILPPSLLPYGVVGANLLSNGQPGYQVPYNGTASKKPTTWLITNLPPGLTYDKTTGIISGRPTREGEWQVTIKASNPFGTSSTANVTMRIRGFPATAIASYVGRIERHSVATSGSLGVNDNLGGRIDFTTLSSGYYTGKLTLGSGTYPITGYLEPVVDSGTGVVGTTMTSNITVKRTGRLPVKVNVVYDSSTDRFTAASTVGELAVGSSTPATTAAIVGWRNKFKVGILTPAGEGRGGYHTFSMSPPAGLVDPATVPQGSSYGSVKVVDSGATTVGGRMADGTSYASGAYLGPTGEVLVFQSLYSGMGSVLGTLNIGTATGHPVTINPSFTWLRKDFGAGSKERSYERGFGLLSLAIVDGGYYSPPVANMPVMGLTMTDGPPATNNVQIDFTSGGIPNALNLPFRISKINSAVMPATNPKVVKFSVDKTTGVFTGTFKLVDPDPTSSGKNVTRTATYYGIITPKPLGGSLGIGNGFFTLAKLPNAAPDAHTSATSDILSGKVVLTKFTGP